MTRSYRPVTSAPEEATTYPHSAFAGPPRNVFGTKKRTSPPADLDDASGRRPTRLTCRATSLLISFFCSAVSFPVSLRVSRAVVPLDLGVGPPEERPGLLRQRRQADRLLPPGRRVDLDVPAREHPRVAGAGLAVRVDVDVDVEGVEAELGDVGHHRAAVVDRAPLRLLGSAGEGRPRTQVPSGVFRAEKERMSRCPGTRSFCDRTG